MGNIEFFFYSEKPVKLEKPKNPGEPEKKESLKSLKKQGELNG